MIENLARYLQSPIVINALIVTVLVALCASLLGVTLVLKRFSFIGDGLSHVAFGAVAIASVLKLTNNMILVMPVTIISAILLLIGGRNRKIKGDAAIAMISVSAMAAGYLLMNVFSTSANLTGDVCCTLFGSTSILTLTTFDVVLCIVVAPIVVFMFIFFYNRIFAVTFDEDFARTSGTRADVYNFVIAVMIAIVIVIAMNFVGSLLISALIVFPALSAMRLFRSFKSVTVFSVIIAVFCAVIGLVVSVLADTPVGSTIVIADIAAFGLCSLIGVATGKS